MLSTLSNTKPTKVLGKTLNRAKIDSRDKRRFLRKSKKTTKKEERLKSKLKSKERSEEPFFLGNDPALVDELKRAVAKLVGLVEEYAEAVKEAVVAIKNLVEANEKRAEALDNFVLIRGSIEAVEECKGYVKQIPENVEDIGPGSDK